ncbi:MAG TPA: hypothetical protein VI636_05180 [Candidatus Angelobacter sp.]
MAYVTQGTIQVELKNGADTEVRINPAEEYRVVHNSKAFIVFIDETNDPTPKARLFKQTDIFTAKSLLVHGVISAAIQQVKIEIKINSRTRNIVSFKIPATLSDNTV